MITVSQVYPQLFGEIFRSFHPAEKNLRFGFRPGYHYNPARPTPAAGGPSFNPMNTGAKDQAMIEV